MSVRLNGRSLRYFTLCFPVGLHSALSWTWQVASSQVVANVSRAKLTVLVSCSFVPLDLRWALGQSSTSSRAQQSYNIHRNDAKGQICQKNHQDAGLGWFQLQLQVSKAQYTIYIYTYHLVTTLGSKIIIKGTLKCKKHICICLAVIYLQLLVAAR